LAAEGIAGGGQQGVKTPYVVNCMETTFCLEGISNVLDG